jgi:hypothetical protein
MYMCDMYIATFIYPSLPHSLSHQKLMVKSRTHRLARWFVAGWRSGRKAALYGQEYSSSSVHLISPVGETGIFPAL